MLQEYHPNQPQSLQKNEGLPSAPQHIQLHLVYRSHQSGKWFIQVWVPYSSAAHLCIGDRNTLKVRGYRSDRSLSSPDRLEVYLQIIDPHSHPQIFVWHVSALSAGHLYLPGQQHIEYYNIVDQSLQLAQYILSIQVQTDCYSVGSTLVPAEFQVPPDC
jgi:hypothetical protein